MKITERSDGALVLEDRPWVMGLVLSGMALFSVFVTWEGLFGGEGWAVALTGLILLGCAIAAMRVAIRRVRLTLDPAARIATLDIRDRQGHRREEWPLDRLKPAIVEVRRDEGETYRLALCFTDRKPLPMTSYFSGGRGPERAKDRLNAWLTGHTG